MKQLLGPIKTASLSRFLRHKSIVSYAIRFNKFNKLKRLRSHPGQPARSTSLISNTKSGNTSDEKFILKDDPNTKSDNTSDENFISKEDPNTKSGNTSDENFISKDDPNISTSEQLKVAIFWDLDNKPLLVSPSETVKSLKLLASRFGNVTQISAYANQHAFQYVPPSVKEEQSYLKQLDKLEHQGLVDSLGPHICGVCGQKHKTKVKLQKHFKRLHVREVQKKVNRMDALRGKKREKFKKKHLTDKNEKFNNEFINLFKPEMHYDFAGELKNAGVMVYLVKDTPQAADIAMKRDMKTQRDQGIDWIILISDDSDFQGFVKSCKSSNTVTVVLGDENRILGKHADFWYSWESVCMGEDDLDALKEGRRKKIDEEESMFWDDDPWGNILNG